MPVPARVREGHEAAAIAADLDQTGIDDDLAVDRLPGRGFEGGQLAWPLGAPCAVDNGRPAVFRQEDDVAADQVVGGENGQGDPMPSKRLPTVGTGDAERSSASRRISGAAPT